jgi:hypothetical protein
LLERLCGHIASGDLTGSPPFDPAKQPASNSLIMVDIKTDIEDFLDAFERACVGRARLTGQPQLACLYSLLVFSMAKSLLIDAYAVRSTCDDVNQWDETYALRITSAFKSMISVFCWSSKADVILSNNSKCTFTLPLKLLPLFQRSPHLRARAMSPIYSGYREHDISNHIPNP